MPITVNGRPQQFTSGQSVADLLATLDLDASRVAVERNGLIVPREDFDRTGLEHGDTIEVVQFVGGG